MYKEFNCLCKEDREELTKSSIHSVVLLSLQRKCDHYNYFNCDQLKLEKYLKIFPILQHASKLMKSLHEKFEKFKLDDKEYAIYSTLLIISTASKNLKDYDRIMDIRERLGTALRQYMIARRNEEITCDEILLTLVLIKRYNSILQKGITQAYFKIVEANPDAFKSSPFFAKVFLPISDEMKQFNANMQINLMSGNAKTDQI